MPFGRVEGQSVVTPASPAISWLSALPRFTLRLAARFSHHHREALGDLDTIEHRDNTLAQLQNSIAAEESRQ